MGPPNPLKKRLDQAGNEPAREVETTSTIGAEFVKKMEPVCATGTMGNVDARRRGFMVKLIIEASGESALRRVLRELSWSLEPASLGELFVWIYTQAHVHPELEIQIKEGIQKQRMNPTAKEQLPSRRTNLMAPAHVAEWFLAVADTVQLQTATRGILGYILANWEAIKTTTGWVPAFTDPDQDLWIRW